MASKSTTLKYLVRATAKLELLSLYISAIIDIEFCRYIPTASLKSFLIKLSSAKASPIILTNPVPTLAIPPVTLNIIYLAEVILRAKSAYLLRGVRFLNWSNITRRVNASTESKALFCLVVTNLSLASVLLFLSVTSFPVRELIA